MTHIMDESKVTGIVKSLNILEGDLDSLNVKVGDIKKKIVINTQTEINNLVELTAQMATKEATDIINASKDKAKTESEKIQQAGQTKVSEIQSNIDSNFDQAVKQVVSIVLKPQT